MTFGYLLLDLEAIAVASLGVWGWAFNVAVSWRLLVYLAWLPFWEGRCGRGWLILCVEWLQYSTPGVWPGNRESSLLCLSLGISGLSWPQPTSPGLSRPQPASAGWHWRHCWHLSHEFRGSPLLSRWWQASEPFWVHAHLHYDTQKFLTGSRTQLAPFHGYYSDNRFSRGIYSFSVLKDFSARWRS